jgi:hypothetical protein
MASVNQGAQSVVDTMRITALTGYQGGTEK